jgi:hypothetical protein
VGDLHKEKEATDKLAHEQQDREKEDGSQGFEGGRIDYETAVQLQGEYVSTLTQRRGPRRRTSSASAPQLDSTANTLAENVVGEE